MLASPDCFQVIDPRDRRIRAALEVGGGSPSFFCAPQTMLRRRNKGSARADSETGK
jgi:hypothetical protein